MSFLSLRSLIFSHLLSRLLFSSEKESSLRPVTIVKITEKVRKKKKKKKKR